jgi:hypothetical protein
MNQLIALLSTGALLGLFAACGSGENQDPEGHAHDAEEHGTSQMEASEAKELPSREGWIRGEPIDLEALDVDHDGFVYQDPMDWNVIADEEGRCPKCGMRLKKVPVAEATENLLKFGFTVAGADPSEGARDF